jgi:hypothetical protein
MVAYMGKEAKIQKFWTSVVHEPHSDYRNILQCTMDTTRLGIFQNNSSCGGKEKNLNVYQQESIPYLPTSNR